MRRGDRTHATGGRHVRINGEIVGLAYSLDDLVGFLREAEVELVDLAQPPLIDWCGVGAEHWGPETPG
ncbi:hypothetical protein F7R91_25775 [Streptomyces luteolifulvus]|uniref:Uncharacterized protein n=1 Tax=Streptomyces luteolifulvus TaxID=2615112 RepID=A0A6H9UWW3_9ACTN|nr:hypothetical protein [Streptomyces luteolifulvus]KAB1143557.1 hypothetical protein F7R91_25775 [Streptomyces luteolifulvus]